jgi:hypothetical protein
MNEGETRRLGKEGNRWVNTVPSADELATWFAANVKIDEKLTAGDYVGGVVLIPAEEKHKAVIGWNDKGPNIGEVIDLVYTPYIRVETRLKYFHDLCAEKGWLGFIDPAPIEKPDMVLPPGFFRYAVKTGADRESRYIACSKRIVIFEASGFKIELALADKRTGEQRAVRTGTLVREAPDGTKAVPTLKGYRDNIYSDDNAVMKAETGAIGRALGMAGMLVIPGSGIATAEDVQESRVQEGEQTEAPTLPPTRAVPLPSEPEVPQDADEAMRNEVAIILGELEESFPDAHQQFIAWAKEKGFGRLSETVSPQLRGMHRRLTAVRDEAVAESRKKAGNSGERAGAVPAA